MGLSYGVGKETLENNDFDNRQTDLVCPYSKLIDFESKISLIYDSHNVKKFIYDNKDELDIIEELLIEHIETFSFNEFILFSKFFIEFRYFLSDDMKIVINNYIKNKILGSFMNENIVRLYFTNLSLLEKFEEIERQKEQFKDSNSYQIQLFNMYRYFYDISTAEMVLNYMEKNFR